MVGDRNATAGTTPEFWYRKALDALLRGRRIDLVHLEHARFEFESTKLYLELGRVYQRLQVPARAREAFEHGRMLESDPDLLEELASLYAGGGEPRKAALALVEALAMDGSRSRLHAKLGEYYSQADPTGCAVTRQGNQSSINFDCPLVKSDICAASGNVIRNYLRRNQQWEADSIRKVAIQDLGCAAAQLQ